MATKFISGTIAGNYALGVAYTSLEIAPSGLIQGQLSGNSQADTITNLGGTVTHGVRLTSGGTITNDTTAARITGYNGSNGSYPSGAGGSGGAGISVAGGGSINNSGTIAGGSGGVGGAGVTFTFNSGAYMSMDGGGSALTANTTTVITNAVVVSPGGAGGSGGSGISLAGGGGITNSDMIAGGNGGQSGLGGGPGGAGGAGIILLNGGSVGNSGAIAGGQGAAGRAPSSGGGLAGGAGGAGISLVASGTIVNSGTIAGGRGGLGSMATVQAAGGAGGSGGTGVSLAGGGILNSATITGGQGGDGGYGGPGGTGGAGGAAVILSGDGTLSNSGTIAGGLGGAAGASAKYYPPGVPGAAGAGIVMTAGGIVGNGSVGAASALISGSVGIQANGASGATVTNYATIVGSSGIAISFGGGGTNLLALGAGYHLTGAVKGSTAAGAIDKLELLGAAGQAVTVNYNGLGLTNFEDVLFGAGGYATLLVSNTTGTIGVTAQGFTATSETIDLTGLAGGTLSGGGIPDGSNQLVISNGFDTVTLRLDGTDATRFTTHADAGTGTDIVPACFCRGTLIRTATGNVAVETLQIGDLLATHSGELCPIKWIGRRGYAGAFVAANPQLRPVRIRADALAAGVPVRDLLVSPFHAVLVQGALIPAAALVNGISIAREPACEVMYLHVELDRHELIAAEGAAVETFIDQDSRMMFHNAAEFAELYPDDTAAPPPMPRTESGTLLDSARRHLAARAGIVSVCKTPGPLRGHVERACDGLIEGWALDDNDPEEPVLLDLILDDAAPVPLIANRYRADLDRAGLAGGRCAFRYMLLRPASRSEVRRRSDGTVLSQPPKPEYESDSRLVA